MNTNSRCVVRNSMSSIAMIAIAAGLAACQSTSSENSLSNSQTSASHGRVIIHSNVNGNMCGSLFTSYQIIGPNGAASTISNDVYLFQKNKPKLDVKSLPSGSYQLVAITCPEVYKISGIGPIATFVVTAGQITDLGVLEMTPVNKSYDNLLKTVRQFTTRELEGLTKDQPQIATSLVYQPMQTAPKL